MIRITHNGRPFDARRFVEEIERKALALGMDALEKKARGAAASIVDPETSRHADVFVDRQPGNRLSIRTSGSPAFARLLEARLGVGHGEVKAMADPAAAMRPKVYLAHASEDKAMVRPIAEHLMANGVEVWFDEWEIEPGDSLRRKMEEGLGAMTHFVVVLTPVSVTKPWVAREIDVGLVRLVGGQSRFVPLVVDLASEALPPFIQAMLYLKIEPGKAADLKSLTDRLHGVSRRPALGSAPTYVRTVPAGLAGWSAAAVAVGRHLVETSHHGLFHDPVLSLDALSAATGLALEDVRLAVLDLKEAGYVWEGGARSRIAPEKPLFVEFDEAFMDFSPREDACVVANHMVSASDRVTRVPALADTLGWAPRRMNSAICYLERAGAIETRKALDARPWRSVQLIRTDHTLRFARAHA